jgi:hypothetical protein
MTSKLRIASISMAVAVVLMLAVGVSLMAAENAEAQAKNTKWVRGSWIQESTSHNAEGHSAHQVVNFFNPQDGFIYNGKVTFTSTKGVDIIAYHDITDQSTNTTGLTTWIVEGKTYATTPIMKNVTTGTVEFVGSGLLAHSASSDPYSVVYSADGFARRVPASQSMMGTGQGMGPTK